MDDQHFTLLHLYHGLKINLRYDRDHNVEYSYSLEIDRKNEHDRLSCLNDILEEDGCCRDFELPKKLVIAYYHYVLEKYNQQEDFVLEFINKLHQVHGLEFDWTDLLRRSFTYGKYSSTLIDRINDFIINVVGIPNPNSVLKGDDPIGPGPCTYPYFIGCNKVYEAIVQMNLGYDINLADILFNDRLMIRIGCDPYYRYHPDYAPYYSFHGYLDNMFNLIDPYRNYTFDQIIKIDLNRSLTDFGNRDQMIDFEDNCRMAKYLYLVATEIGHYPEIVEKIEKLGQIYRNLVVFYGNSLVVDLIFNYLRARCSSF